MKQQIMKALLELPKLYSNGNKKPEDIEKVVKLFNPYGIGTWYLTEYDPKKEIAFGRCELQFSELGYVYIPEIFDAIPHIEMDLYTTPKWSEISG